MKTRALACVGILAAVAAGRSEGVAPDGVTSALGASAPVATGSAAPTPPVFADTFRGGRESVADQSVVAMDTFTVVESYQRRSLTRSVEAVWKTQQALEFSWSEGGTALTRDLGPLRAQAGLWYRGNGFGLLKLSW